MKKLLTILSLVAIVLFSAGFDASAKDAKDNQPKEATVVFTLSTLMHCQNCENKIKNNLRFEKGVKAVATDLKEQTVTVVYKPKDTTPEKLAKALEKIGYTCSKSEE